tara:strand:+ start:11903 stop:12280 length:378 start_codon:yes stop_codon:yes gene_type:complete
LIEGLELAKTAATLADDMQAEEIMVLDLKGISSITDYFVICTGTSKPHLKAIQREIREKLKNDHGVAPASADGKPESEWVVLDYGDVIVHVFHTDKRGHFALEDLWGDAPRIELELEGAAVSADA